MSHPGIRRRQNGGDDVTVWIARHLKKSLYIIGLITTIVLAGHFTISVLDSPYIGVYVSKAGQEYRVTGVAPYSWGQSADVRAGDLILRVDGRTPSSFKSITEYGLIGPARQIDLLRGSDSLSKSVDNYISKSAMFFFLVIPASFFLICFSSACFLYMRKERNQAVSILIALLIVAAPLLLEMSGNARHDSWSLKWTSFALVFTLILLAHFLNAYFSSYGFSLLSKWMLGSLYLCGVFIVGHSAFIVDRQFSAYYPQELIFAVFVFALLCFQLARLYACIRKTEYRRLIQILMAGFFLAVFPFVALYALPNMFIGTSLVPVEWTTPFVVFLPLTLCSLVLSGVFIDMSFEIGRLGYYSLLSFCMTFIILSGFLILMQEELAGNPGDVLSLGSLIFCAGLLGLYARGYLDYGQRRHLRVQKQRQQESLNRFLQWSKTEYTLHHVELMLRETVMSRLPVGKAAVVRINDDGQIFTLDGKISRMALSLGGLYKAVNQSQTSDIYKNSSGFAVVLRRNRNEKIVLACNWKKPARLLNLDERMWLETLLNYAKVVIDNLYKTEGLLRQFRNMETDRSRISAEMNRFLFSISEKERQHLSRDLHDTNVQDQLAIAREIDAEIGQVDDPLVKRQLSYARERILDHAEDLRKIIRDWYPDPALKEGLGRALQEFFSRINLSADFRLETHIDPVPPDLGWDRILCVYRVVQELLHNAIRHARAGHVFLFIRFSGSGFSVDYRDDGIGMDTATVAPSFSTMGLPGLISRVEGLGGRVRLTPAYESTGRSGLSVRLLVPAETIKN